MLAWSSKTRSWAVLASLLCLPILLCPPWRTKGGRRDIGYSSRLRGDQWIMGGWFLNLALFV
jgi:hypothetical protein